MAARKPELSVRLFGNFALEIDGRPFVMATPRRTLPLFAYLLLNRGAAVSREFLAYFIWPDDEEESARAKLRGSLYDLARVLPANRAGRWILADGDNVVWNPDARLRLDVEEFEAACADPERREAGVELYRGELLTALYDEWIFPPRERYRNLYLATLTQLLSEARRLRDFPRAIARAQQLLAVDPWREDVVRRLIAVRYESGDRSGALVEYQHFAERLRAELDIEPMPESQSLRDAIARDAPIPPEPVAKHVEAAPALSRTPSLPFVGRAAELELLTEAWSRAARGNGSAVFVGGESGVGKSRLALEFAHRVEELGGRVMLGTTGTPEALPYQCLIEALRSALPLVAALQLREVWLAGVATLVPELRAHLPALPELPRIEAGGERPRLFEALYRTLTALAQPRPLLLVLDDVQWAEESTSAALEFLLGRLSSSRVLIVLTYRDDELPRLHPLQRLRRDAVVAGSARSLSLRALSLGEVEQLVRVLPASFAGSAGALFASSEGSPIFLAQLVDDGGTAFSERSGANVRTLVAERLDRLSAEARTIAEIAALAGTRFSREVLHQVSGWAGGAADDALDELIDRRIVREASGRGFFDYAFAHRIVQETVAQNALPERCATRHRRIARALEDLYPERADELAAGIARHYDLAGEPAAAAPRYLAAARQALSVGALDEAAAHVARGLALASEHTVRVDLLLVGETLAARRNTHDRREAILGELDALTTAMPDDQRRFDVLLRRVEFANAREDRGTEAQALTELRRVAQGEADPGRLGLLRIAEAQRCFGMSHLIEAEAHAEAALAAFLQAGSRSGEAEARYRLAEIVTHRGRIARAEILLDEARAAGERAQDASLSLRALEGSFQLAYASRNLQRGLEVAQATLDKGLATGDRRAEAEGHKQLGVTLITLGVLNAQTRDHFQAAADIYRETRDDLGVAATLINATQLQMSIGDMRGARRSCERALEIFAARGLQNRRMITCLMTLSSAEAYDGAGEAGKAHALEALTLARTLGYRVLEASALEDVAYTEGACGEYGAAIEHMQQSLALRAETDSLAWTGISHAQLALWSAALGELEAARAHLARMYEMEEELARSTPWPQSCYWAAAQVLRACGEPEAAQRELARASALMAAALEGLDAADRAPFLALAWHRDIAAATETGVWPEPPR